MTVGAGQRLFTEDAPAMGYTLVDSGTTSRGAVCSALRPAPFEVGRVEVVEGRESA